MATPTVKIFGTPAKVARALERHLARAAKRAPDRAGDEAVRQLAARAPRRSGALSRSFRRHPAKGDSALAGSTLPYAEIQDTGGLVKASRASRLAVPLTSIRQRPREIANIFELRGRGLLARRIGGRSLQITHHLQREVRLKGHNYVAQAIPRTEKAAEASGMRELEKAAEAAARANDTTPRSAR